MSSPLPLSRYSSFEEAGRSCPREGAEFGYLFRQSIRCYSSTVQRDRLAYVRVCVEVMPKSELPKEVLLMNNEGIQTIIPVEYEWVFGTSFGFRLIGLRVAQ